MVMQKLSASLVVCLVLFALASNAAAQKKESQELFIFWENNLMGYIDKTGKVVIPAQFAEADDFSDGMAWVNGKDFFGYIDKTGHPVIDFKSLRLSGTRRRFSEGFAAFSAHDDRGNFRWG